jgi:hypothetical protein
VLPALGILAAALQVVWTLVLARGDLTHGALPGTLGLLGVADAAYLAALALVVVAVRSGRTSVNDGRALADDGRALADDGRALALVALAAVAFRVTLLPLEPSLSTDAWRYLWEGRVQLAGHDPYATAPAHASLAGLRDGVWLRVNHPEVPAVYGPLLEALFALLAALPGQLLPFKLTFVAADLAVGALLARALRRRGLPPLLAIVWLWHPLPVLEVAGQAHLEVVPLALLLLALDLHATGRARVAALALGAAIAAKYLPILVVPALLARARDRRDALVRLVLVALPCVVCALPYLRGLAAPADTGLGAFAYSWRFNDGGFFALTTALEALGLSQAFCRHVLPAFVDVPAGFDPALHTTWILLPAKLVAGALTLALVVHVARAARSSDDLAPAALAATAAFLLLSPVVHPWYALWVVPFLPLGSRFAAPLLLLSLTLPLSYEVLLRYDGTAGTWSEAAWVRAVVHLPSLAWLALSVVLTPRADYQ